jgi:uncharacterized cupin superfamily protein
MPRLDLDAFPQINATGYPSPWREEMAKRHYRRLGPASGLSDFGVSHVTLEPGGVSSQRHWHEDEDEFVVMLQGEAVLVEEEGETVMRPGDCASFPKGVANGHRLINRGDSPCVFVAIGRHALSNCHYPDIDLFLDGATSRFTRKDGTPY